MSLPPEVLQIFRDEAEERLDRIEQSLLALESSSDGGELVDALFRDVHSIKGNAGVVGMHDVRAIAHEVEDVLERARSGEERVDVDPLLRAVDTMRKLIAAGPQPEPVSAPEPEPERAPARSTMRVASEKVDDLLDAVGELGRSEGAIVDVQRSVIGLRMLPLSSITGPFPRAVRDVAAAQGKQAALEISGAETQLDRVILDGISETIVHLLRNAVTHGVEAPDARAAAGKDQCGRIELRAEQRGGTVAIEVHDDGRGVAAHLLAEAAESGSLAEVLARPGLSTAGAVTQDAGRGVGLDAVKAHVEALGGSLEVHSETGAGTCVTLLLPLTVALLRVLLVERGGQPFGLPLSSVQEVTIVERPMVLGGRASIERDGAPIPLVDLASVLGGAATPLADHAPAAIVASSQRHVAVRCDRLLGEEEAVVKSLGLLAGVPGYLGAAILDDGRIALILDPAHLVTARAPRDASSAPAPVEQAAAKVLVVDDQFTVRELQRSILEAAGYRVVTAGDGREALGELTRDTEIDLVATDVQMPEMDGFALLEAIRALPERGDMPVVIVTSQGGEEQRRRGAELGADGYVVKDDFDQQALLTMVHRLVEH